MLGADKPVLVDFWAEWCGPCKMIAPALEEISGELGDKVDIVKLNIDENPDTPGQYGVRGIPTMLLFKDGEPVAQKVGAAPQAASSSSGSKANSRTPERVSGGRCALLARLTSSAAHSYIAPHVSRSRAGEPLAPAIARPASILRNFHARRTGQEHLRIVQRPLRPLSSGKIVDAINGFEPTISAMTDDELQQPDRASSAQRLADGAKLDDLLPEAFATVREAAKRTLGQRHYDVQMIGGIALHRGEIAEMRTGEGKTLVATLAIYLNALPGKGVHVVTVNDYLARRDADWMGQIYRFLGLSVGVIVPNLIDHAAPRRLQRRHHLRDQQRARLRLSARQYEIFARPDGPAAVPFRHRRRGRFDPDRRGAHAADHLRPDRRQVASSTSASTRIVKQFVEGDYEQGREAEAASS